jgi:hypothetical protein
VNENKALRQGAQSFVFSSAAARPHSPSKVSADLHQPIPKGLIVVPKPSIVGGQSKPKVLPGLVPLHPIAPSPRNETDFGPENAAPEVKPRPTQKERGVMGGETQGKRHPFEPIAPLVPEEVELPSLHCSDDPLADHSSTPAPILRLVKRSVKKLG